MKYNKLVRNNIPDIIRANGGVPVTKKLKPAEYKKALLKKLQEEAAEVAGVRTVPQLIGELADVEEVLDALRMAYNIKRTAVSIARRAKRKKRGGFSNHLYLKEVK